MDTAKTAGAADTRQRLIDQARELYLREGLAGLSMRKVAQAAGVSATAIYRHFDSKEHLLSAVCSDGFRLFGEYLWRGLRGTTPRERLDLTGLGYLHFGLEHTTYYRVMFLSSAEDLGFFKIPETTAQRTGSTFHFLVDRVRECIGSGDLMAGDPVALAATIWAHTHGLVSLYIGGHFAGRFADTGALEAFYQDSLAHLIRGLAPR